MKTADFPLLLAGPIVRRCEEGRVCLWVATSRMVEITTDFYQITYTDEKEAFNYILLETGLKVKSIQLGKRLFIYLLSLYPKEPTFPFEELIGYNLHFYDGEHQHSLESLNLLSPNHPYSIVYGSLKYPTFFIKNQKESTIFYGSCRKLHGEEDDALSLADAIMAESYNKPEKRPDSLFLMGDQIYADDVAHPIFRTITTFSKELIGELEPLEEIDSTLKLPLFQERLQQLNGRQYITENFCQFTSNHAENHLMELGEFAAMYLLAWSPALWETAQALHLFHSFEEAEQEKIIHFTFPPDNNSDKEHRAERNRLYQKYMEQQEALVSFQETLFKVRRLLANIPTYMIFDDHDITDDWNLSESWKNNVYTNSPLGRHVIANGLTAYWAFQGWGNDPDSFDHSFIKTIKSYLKSPKIFSESYQSWIETLLNFNSWDYVAPTYPKAVFLDTRTQREDDPTPTPVKMGKVMEETASTPLLLSERGWRNITNKVRDSGWQSNTPLIIVSATPVYGMGLIESFLHKGVYPLRVLGVEVQTTFDFEAWKYNGQGFTTFLEQTANWIPSTLIILSGDVHYATAVHSIVTFNDGRKLPIYQFTSSPLKNMSFSGLWGLFLKLVITWNTSERKNKIIKRICTKNYNIVRIKGDPDQPFIWTDELSYQLLNGKTIIETNNNLGLLSLSRTRINSTLLK
ncbi:hypothetical protein [Neobacillus sp. LXY-1]|uniref:hypothetical protein n=1 Tax=Neobacillus sp. LXY-1 TaxID=3379133 RepID=UPI003EE0C40C